MNERTAVESIIRALEPIVLRPGMYVLIGEYSVENFLHGFHVACRAFDIEYSASDPLWREITLNRGWDWNSSYGPSYDMREKGLSEEQITVEMLAIELEYWQQKLEQLAEGS